MRRLALLHTGAGRALRSDWRDLPLFGREPSRFPIKLVLGCNPVEFRRGFAFFGTRAARIALPVRASKGKAYSPRGWSTALAGIVLSASVSAGAEGLRVQRSQPTRAEAENIAVEIAKTDGLLRPGDIVVTPRGFLMFKGVAPDGYTNEFQLVPNPPNQNGFRKN